MSSKVVRHELLMIGLNGKVRTESESKGYYRDVLQSQLNNTFNLSDDRLLFITYQPTEKTYLSETVINFTNSLFKDYPYIEVIERTYKYSAKKNGCSYDDTYHSHILIRLDDYKELERKLGYNLGVKLDIVDRIVWDLDGLVDRYLIKQKGITSLDMDMPIRHVPLKKTEPITIPETVTETISVEIKLHGQGVLKVFHNVLKIIKPQNGFINKIDVKHRFIDDT